jgi:hypothetical protein
VCIRKTQVKISTTNIAGKKKWFIKECYDARNLLNNARTIFLRNKSVENKNEFLNKKRSYIKIKKNCKRIFQRKEG